MRVLQLGPFPPPYGGVQTNLVAIRSFLRKNGIYCAVINVTRHRKPDADDVYYPANPMELLTLLGRLRYDLVHQHFGGMLTNRILGLSLVCTLRPGVKSVLTFHSGGFPSTPEGIALGPNSFAGFVLRRFDGLIAVNEEIAGFFRKLRVSSKRARVISPYSFVADDDSSALPGPVADFLSSHNPVLISAGQLEPEYDLALQIDAVSKIRERFPSVGLLLLGSGTLDKDLRSKIADRRCQDHVLLPGDVPHAATIECMSRSRILLRTTWYDGDAISVREAMQVGTPVIATETALRPTGVRLIPKSDLGALIRAIDEELQQPAPAKQLTAADDSSVRQVVNFYEDLLAGRTA
jgi:glycogen synthase